MGSIWRKTATLPSFPPLAGDTGTRVLVVGQGHHPAQGDDPLGAEVHPLDGGDRGDIRVEEVQGGADPAGGGTVPVPYRYGKDRLGAVLLSQI